ncbi:MAG: hypothetical protein Q7T05_05750 [Dehalococcoidia bacterium]|nr:hypothetical protein [Dehalococcoidia bacterium]
MSEESLIQLPTVYVGLDDAKIVFGNAFVIQHLQNEFILTIGQLAPPILLGSPEEQLEQAKRLGYVPIRIMSRTAFTRDRMVELIAALQSQLKAYDEGQGRNNCA